MRNRLRLPVLESREAFRTKIHNRPAPFIADRDENINEVDVNGICLFPQWSRRKHNGKKHRARNAKHLSSSSDCRIYREIRKDARLDVTQRMNAPVESVR